VRPNWSEFDASQEADRDSKSIAFAYSKKNVDLELPPSDEEILQQWERDGPDK
jgi:hypothetical protein